MKKIVAILSVIFLLSTTNTALAVLPGDANNDSKVDGLDYVIWLTNYGSTQSGISKGDFNADSKVDGLDYVIWLTNYGKVETTPTPISQTGEWSQFGGNAQKTNYTSQVVNSPWRLRWQWNAAGADDKKSGSHLSVASSTQPITGDQKVYMVANDTVYALNASNGSVAWTKSGIGTLRGNPAFALGNLYVPSTSGIYKLNSSNGQTVATFSGQFEQALVFANSKMYAVSNQGVLYSVNPQSMTSDWQYAGGSAAATMPAYSQNSNVIVYVTQDLYVHAVNSSNGGRVWRIKPTIRNYESGIPGANGAQAEGGWPVIADQHGIVFIRYRVDWNTIWTWNPFPTTNSAIRSNLVSQPSAQTLFALRLSDGGQAFVPAVGSGGQADGGDMSIGPKPVVKIVDGKEVAYIIWRNGLTCQSASWCDAREDASMGEMVLDSSTVSGYSAGDVRFIEYEDIQTDEMMNITISGDYLFHSHWLVNEAYKITNRTASVGSTFANPIQTTAAPYVIWRQCNGSNVCGYPGCTGNTTCGLSCAPSSSRYCGQGLYSYGDARSYPSGFYQYMNDFPYTEVSTGGYYTQQAFTVVSNDLLMVKTIDGGLMAFEAGSPVSISQSDTKVAGASTLFDKNTVLPIIDQKDALRYVGSNVIAKGKILSVADKRPKGIYLGFKEPHDGALLIRVFEKDLNKFTYDLSTLKGKNVEVSGGVSLYWPEGVDPEIVVDNPNQIVVK